MNVSGGTLSMELLTQYLVENDIFYENCTTAFENDILSSVKAQHYRRMIPLITLIK